MKHVHCDLIKAWADGDQIQLLHHGCWEDVDNPSWVDVYQYRIKPELVPIYPEGFEYQGPGLLVSKTQVKVILEEFVKSGKLQQYVTRHGLDGLKSYECT